MTRAKALWWEGAWCSRTRRPEWLENRARGQGMGGVGVPDGAGPSGFLQELFLLVLGIKPRASHMINTQSVTELHPQLCKNFLNISRWRLLESFE
jgi:hypothetical protein